MTEPLIVEVRRGSTVESRHEIDAVAVDGNGRVVESWGDHDRNVMPRSAIKPIQAAPLVMSGAAEAMDVSDAELALACSSHNGEPMHTMVIERWLERIGCSHRSLACGVHRPIHLQSADDLIASGEQPSELHNNCSGKHAGFLTLARHLGAPVDGYLDPDHPVQRDLVTPAIEDLCQTRLDPTARPPAVDGCGAPVWSLPLPSLALGWAQLRRRGAGQRLLDAMAAHPQLVAGSDRACTDLIERSEGTAVVKTGAEGVYCGVDVRDGSAFALKVRDGATRAAECAAEWLLDRWGAIEHAAGQTLTNWSGTEVGHIAVAG